MSGKNTIWSLQSISGSDEGVNIYSVKSVMYWNWQYDVGMLIAVEYPWMLFLIPFPVHTIEN
jgi:hypothetical protein